MSYDPADSFHARVQCLPRLGVGISTEFGAGREGLDVHRLAEQSPDLVGFLEIGADLERGIDGDATRWVDAGRPTTYHFLDVNLEEPEDVDDAWCVATAALAKQVGAAWLCGDAGLWHIGRRERGHGVLMPPILTESSAASMAEAVGRLRERTGFEILPENPPANVYLGDLHLLDYFGKMAGDADSGLLLDVAHLAIYQRVTGHRTFDGLDGFPLDRIVEVHVAGGTPFDHEGLTFFEDDHGPEPLEDTWQLFEHVVANAPNLKAVVYECERNAVAEVTPGFRRLNNAFPRVEGEA